MNNKTVPMFAPPEQSVFANIPLSSTGKDIQINNGTTFSSMFANSFSSVSQPYSFNLSQNFGSTDKENSLSVFNGREGIVGRENGAQFFFAIGDILVNGQNISFVSVPDSVSISSSQVLNGYFESEPVMVNSNSNLVYGVNVPNPVSIKRLSLLFLYC